MSAGEGSQQLQQLSEELQAIEEALTQHRAEVEALREEQSDIDDAVEALETLETDSTVQVPLGGDAYVRAEIENVDEVIVSLGGGYAAEHDRDGAAEALQTKREAIDERIEKIQGEISDLEEEGAQLEQQAQQLQGQLQQQQVQGMQDDG